MVQALAFRVWGVLKDWSVLQLRVGLQSGFEALACTAQHGASRRHTLSSPPKSASPALRRPPGSSTPYVSAGQRITSAEAATHHNLCKPWASHKKNAEGAG
eukprot:577481-Rhodomonas_salina.1